MADADARGRGLDGRQWQATFRLVLDKLRLSAGRHAATRPADTAHHDPQPKDPQPVADELREERFPRVRTVDPIGGSSGVPTPPEHSRGIVSRNDTADCG